MSTSFADVAERVQHIRERILRAGGGDVGIVAVTKGFGVEAIAAAVAAGITMVGENYAQEAVPKVLRARADGLEFSTHFIGHLQSNKVRSLAPVVDVWQTIDRASLVDEVAGRAVGARVFVQVNATGEDTKFGCLPGDVAALVGSAFAAGVVVEGLMAMGPTDGDAARTRAAFATTRALADRLGLRECSMGMSADLEIAVAEGATLVRIGSALFGPRSSH
ncbi:MAG: YggS family pyridoxal phosphate-dependent enzyme [Actinobacteria bacterium]|uniref:Unannotated protein n=1 Tax=freshwater metagenome TaxID=449393 RepID=A0A6J6P339_9ZZZZ|nr:YggS family pyridoxal phosphate-dependent enzyme [Actinomycetota bacterium]MSY11502.1 YggS family pyridoxal phosphate-dependent enzyme [Actinomycetota bacterium]MSZ03827.1 YggS family pyridoxal phosphate-dependent enzyme [Actinomycetota bacterium]